MNQEVVLNPRDRLVQLMFQVLRGTLPVEHFCSKYEWIHIHELDGNTIDNTKARILREVFDAVVYYSPFEVEVKQHRNYRGETEIMSTVREAIHQLNGGVAEVPQPVDFLATWGVEPFESDTDNAYGAYDLGPICPEADSNLILEFSGAESWLRTELETGQARSSMSSGGLQRLDFIQSETPMRTLVGLFTTEGGQTRVEIEVHDALRVKWLDIVYFPEDDGH